MYEFLVWATGAVAFGLAFIGYRMSRDVFHPVLFLGPMLAYSYWLVPLVLADDRTVWRLLPESEMDWVQGYYLAGVTCLCGGTLLAGVPRRRVDPWLPSPEMRRQLLRAGVLLGGIGSAAYLYMVTSSGGFETAYAKAHGGGSASSGYVREAFYLTIPGLMLILLSSSGGRLRRTDQLWLAACAAPMAFHGIVSAARGPSFLVFVTLAVGYYVVRNRRPPFLVAFGSLGTLGVLLLILVTHREMIHLGSDSLEFKGLDTVLQFVGRPTPGNEYVFGSGVVIDAAIRDDYQWGARYFIQTVIRAIPAEVWPTQYQDSARFFGIAGIQNSVLGNLSQTLGWSATGGASMSLLADVWKQLWWFGLGLLVALGWLHGYVWRRAMANGRIWTLVLVLLLALSIFTTQQTLQAMLFRVLWMGGVGWIVWRLMVRDTYRRTVGMTRTAAVAASKPVDARLRSRAARSVAMSNGPR